MKKRILSLALALVMCLGLFTVPASAASATMTEIVSAETVERLLGSGKSLGALTFGEGIVWIGNTAIDTTGKIVIESVSDSYKGNFSDGVAWLTLNTDNKNVLIDKTGRELCSTFAVLTIESSFHEGICKVFSEDYIYIDKTGKKVAAATQNSWGFSDGLGLTYDSASAYYGYVDTTGKVVIPCQYSAAGDFVNGIAAVQIGSHQTVIDKTGKDLLPQEYRFAGDLSKASTSQVIIVQGKDYGTVFMNRAGQVVSSGYNSVCEFSDGMAKVEKGNSYGFVNETGLLVVPCEYRRADDFRDGFALVQAESGGPYSIINKAGNVTGTFTSESYSPVTAGNGCFRIESHEASRTRYGFVDYTGKTIVPYKYAEVGKFSGGVAPVKNFDQKWGFVDTNGTEIVPCQYIEVNASNEPGIFSVKDNDWKWSVLKSSGWTAPATPSTPQQPAQPQTLPAAPTNDKLTVNGAPVAPAAYKISGANYFKLRDVAAMLNGSPKQFNVGYDSATQSVTITTGQAYQANGTELKGAPTSSQAAAPSNNAVYINGVKTDLTVYKINGENYFQIRDLGQKLDFNVGWTSERGMFIEGDKSYDPNN